MQISCEGEILEKNSLLDRYIVQLLVLLISDEGENIYIYIKNLKYICFTFLDINIELNLIKKKLFSCTSR